MFSKIFNLEVLRSNDFGLLLIVAIIYDRYETYKLSIVLLKKINDIQEKR